MFLLFCAISVLKRKINDVNIFSVLVIGVDNCEIKKPCMNGGECMDTETDIGYICNCTNEFEGQNCTLPIGR